MEFNLEKTSEFNEWFLDQTDKIKGLVTARFSRIEVAGHFGVVNSVGDGVFELKWKIGLRVYFAYLDRKRIVVLLGGTKHGQKADIKKAKSLLG
ncbi:MAG TPA: type II toxin-antitoxin system RelE/ParE family toxin [Pseudobdellovibrionaceae bacterium]|nr:type II toxin-antitoxin system RelE/ParE family toxin [Pseudobdellovibrionaceae bacterium]